MNERKILYLEADEEIPGVIDRLRQEKAEQITLVIPKSSIVLQSVINLRLILRLSKELKKSIALVSHDPIGRNLASQVGIPAYDSVNAKIPVLPSIGPKPPSDNEIVEMDNSLPDDSFPINNFQAEDEPQDEIDAITSEEIDELKIKGSKVSKPSLADTEIEDEGLPVITEEKKPIRTQPKSPGKKSNKKKFGYFVAVLLGLMVMAGGFAIFYPKANIVIAVNGQKFENSEDITASVSQKEVNLDDTVIPASYAESIQEKSQKVTATGTKDIGNKASGTIDFYNSYSGNKEQLPAGTRLSKDGKDFITTEDITIPGGTASLQTGGVTVINPGHTTGKIEATNAGEDYNVSKGNFAIADLPSGKQSKVYGESSKELTGGSTEKVTVVSQSDINNAKDELVSSLEDKAKQDLADQLKGKVLLDKAINSEVVSSDPDKSVGDETDSFNLRVKVKVEAIAFDSASFRTVFLDKAKNEVTNDKELLVTDKDEISTEVKNLDIDAKKIVVTGNISTQIGPKIDQGKLRAELTGKKVSRAKEIISQIDGVNNVSININPNWLLGYLPLSARQIGIKIDYK